LPGQPAAAVRVTHPPRRDLPAALAVRAVLAAAHHTTPNRSNAPGARSPPRRTDPTATHRSPAKWPCPKTLLYQLLPFYQRIAIVSLDPIFAGERASALLGVSGPRAIWGPPKRTGPRSSWSSKVPCAVGKTIRPGAGRSEPGRLLLHSLNAPNGPSLQGPMTALRTPAGARESPARWQRWPPRCRATG